MPIIALLLTSLIAVPPEAGDSVAPQAGGALRIVVIEGEDAVNIIQQKTAVAPVIEVRDRNDQPVAGAIVNFAIRSGRATFGGARTLSVTTNAAGRAIAAGFAPTGSGALQISATAAFQGQTAAAVTIAQTTVQTAAQAAAVGSATTAGGGSGGGAGASAGAGGGGGGGLSATTIGIVGAAAGAGALVAANALKEEEPAGPTAMTLSGTFSGTLPMTIPGSGGATCTRNEAQTGTLEMDLSETNGTVTGTARVRGSILVTPGTCSSANQANNGTEAFSNDSAPVSGTTNSIGFANDLANNFPALASTDAYSFAFTGAFSSGQVTGTLIITRTLTSQGILRGTGSVTYNVTLR